MYGGAISLLIVPLLDLKLHQQWWMSDLIPTCLMCLLLHYIFHLIGVCLGLEVEGIERLLLSQHGLHLRWGVGVVTIQHG